MAGAHGVDQADRCQWIALDKHVIGGAGNAVWPFHDHLREAVRALDEVAVRVGREQRYVIEIGIGEVDAQQIARLRLHHFPGGHAANFGVGIKPGAAETAIGAQITIGDQLAGRHRIANGIELVSAQEHLVRWMRGIGLVLVDKRRGGVHRLVRGVVGSLIHGGIGVVKQYSVRAGARHLRGPRHNHEVGRAARNEEWIIGQQRNEDRAITALGREIEAVVEKLAEEGEPRIEGRRQAYVRGDVGNKLGQTVVGGTENAIQAGTCNDLGARGCQGRGNRRLVVGGLVGDQVGDRARRGIEYRASRL